MMQQNINLLSFNTFQVEALAKYFDEIRSLDDLRSNREFITSGEQLFFLGNGANVLLVEDFNGLVLRNCLKGVEVLDETESEVLLKIASGENWDQFVQFSVGHNWSGIENLAFIPGTMGAAVVQNIAAYGQNFEDVVVKVEVMDLKTGDQFWMEREECQFSYRTSILKKEEQKYLFVTSVVIKLSKKPQFNLDYHSRYESLSGELMGKTEPYSVQDIYEAVVSLRMKKLPDWRVVGTAGSFFKNPIISKEHFQKLSQEVKELQFYPVHRLDYDEKEEILEEDFVKVPAGRLLDELGWKGKQLGKVGTFAKQALCVINLGGASGREILKFSQAMAQDVLDNYDITLEPEVHILEN